VPNLHLGLTKANIIYKIILGGFLPEFLTYTKGGFLSVRLGEMLIFIAYFVKNEVLIF